MQPFLDVWLRIDTDALHRQEVFDWNEKPGKDDIVATRNWTETKSWLAETR